MPRWSWVLADGAGAALPGSSVGRGRRLIFDHNREAEARITFSLQDEAARQVFLELASSIPQLRVYRDTTLVFSGLWSPMNFGSAVGEQSYVNLVFKDAFHQLRTRFIRADVAFTYNVPPTAGAGLIAKDLIDTTNTLSDTTIKTDADLIETTVGRTRAYTIGKQLGEAIVELTEVLDGFDWWPTYLDPTTNSDKTMELNIALTRGADQEAVHFEYGTTTLANCKGYTASTNLPVTRAIGLGGGDPQITAEKSDATAESNFGSYMTVVSATDVIEQATLDDKTQDAIRQAPAHVTDITADPALSPMYWDDFEVGDTVHVGIDDGAMQLDVAPRVNHVEIGLDESDNVEDLVIGFDPESQGGYLPNATTERALVRHHREIERRLAALEH